MKKEHIILISILFVALLVRVLSLGQVLFGDELFYAETAKEQAYINYYAGHPPISFWAHNIWAAVFGAASWSARLLVALLSLASIFLTYHLAKRYAGARAGLFAAGLLTLSAWFTTGSMQLDMHASFVSLFLLATVAFYLKWYDDNETKYLILTGVMYGLAVTTHVTTSLIGIILFAHYLITRKPFEKKEFIKCIQSFSVIAGIGIAFFIAIVGGVILAGSETALTMFKFSQLAGTHVATGSFFTMFIQFLNALVWISPLFIGIFLYSLLKDRTNVYIIWAIGILFFYVFILQDPFKPIEKYLLSIAPPLSILGGAFLSRIITQKKHLAILATSAIVWLFFLIIFNQQAGTTIPFYPKAQFLTEALQMNMLLNMPLMGHAGPVGFYVLLGTIAFTFAVCAVLFLLSLTTKKSMAVIMMLLFFGISIGYNLYLGEEYVFGSVKPNVNKVSKDMLNTLLASQVHQPLFIFRNIGFDYYLEEYYKVGRNKGESCTTYSRQLREETIPCIDKDATFYLDFKDENDPETAELIRRKQPTVAVIDFPQIDKQSILWQTLMDCTITNVFKDKEAVIGYIFDCAEAKHA